MTTRLVIPLLALAFGVALATSAPAQVAPSPADPGFPDLVAGLRAIPGNLGVETARTAGGKNVIFAWFEDKDALLRWYDSDMHRGVQDRFFPDRPPHTPLAHVPDGTGPILAVASITMADQPQFEGTTSLPISQISIELYTPLPGGLSLGGTFAPEGMEVPHMIQLGPYGEHEHSDER